MRMAAPGPAPLCAAMDLDPLDPPLRAGLPRTFPAAPRPCGQKKPEWYRQVGGGPEAGAPFGRGGAASCGALPEAAPPPRWLQGCCGAPAESSGRDESDSDSDLVFLVSSAEQALLRGPFLQDGVGHAAAPLAPAASQRCCLRRRSPPLSSPGPDSSLSEASSDSELDALLHRARPVVLLSELSAVCRSHAPFSLQVSGEDSDVVEVAPERSAEDAFQSEEDKAPPTEVRRSGRIRSSAPETPPSACRTPRLGPQRRAKNGTVGIYYESCESDAEGPPSPPQTASEGRREESETASGGGSARLTGQKRGGDQGPAKAKARRRRRWRRRRRRRRQERPADVRLRAAKEQKKRSAGGFCPFVRVDRSSCVVVNFREDQGGAGAGRAAPPSAPGFVPNTSCCRPGRCSPDGERRAAPPPCCLCGQTANAPGLGDLHGPYRPAGPAGSRQDQKAPPTAPPELWVHEDCGIWAAGVFLACSVCRRAGAILGCVLKSCGRSFHYRCALQSGCVLNEDNFSVRCSDHEVKLWTSGRRRK